jgi:hypothetical protein
MTLLVQCCGLGSQALFFEVITGEGGPALLYLMTAAVGTGNPAFLMICERQNLRECFFTGVAEELVVGHWDLRVVVKGSG